MSQSRKKSGGRDISDLKARLGLKKGGPASRKQRGGVVAPPGMKSKPSAVPVPPGAKPPAPEIPSASDDPFAAMNALAAVGVAQQHAKGPEIIVVNDGAPVENVETKSRVVSIAKYAGMVLVPLVVGIIVGQISQSAKGVNNTIKAAGVLNKDVKTIRLGIQDNILNPLLTAQERGEKGAGFKINDKELTEALDGKDKLPVVDPEVAFTAYMFDLDEKLRADVLYFYSKADALNKAVEAHVQKAKADAKGMTDGDKQLLDAKLGEEENAYLFKALYTQYAIYFDMPKQGDKEKIEFGARLVELGPPVCQDRKASTTGKCPQTIGFGYRVSSGAPGWELKELGNPTAEGTIPTKKLLPLVKTPLLDELIKGGTPSVAAVGYLQRVQDLFVQADELVKFGNGLEKALKSKANQGESFTFFL